MSGGYLLGLIGFSMASLFAIAGLLMNFQVWRAARRAKPGERVASAIPILPGVVAGTGRNNHVAKAGDPCFSQINDLLRNNFV